MRVQVRGTRLCISVVVVVDSIVSCLLTLSMLLLFISGIPEQMRNTPAGRDGSRKHNSMLRLATLRHAIVAQLRSPPLGFEEVTQRHFSLCRKRLLAQARRWMLEEQGTTLYPRFEKVYAELLRLLLSLKQEEQQLDSSIPPLPEDLEYLKENDPSFPQVDRSSTSNDVAAEDRTEQGTEIRAQFATDSQVTHEPRNADYNPWANPNVVPAPFASEGVKADDADDDDDPDEDLYS
jgi:hypothetical protein